MTKHLTDEIIQKIRKEIQNGKSKYRTAAEYDIHPNTVYKITQDLPGGQFGWPGIRGKTLKLLQELMQHGYILSNKLHAGSKYHILKKYFSNINKINMYNKTILFLDDKAPVAARAFLSDMNKKIMSFQELKQVTRTFGIELSSKEKHKYVVKPRKRVLPVIRRKDGGFLSSYHQNQKNLDDFIDETGFFGKNRLKKSYKNGFSENDVLLKNDDSLAFFYIRKY